MASRLLPLALQASGVSPGEELESCLKLFDRWLRKLELACAQDTEEVRAEFLFRQLWQGKPLRYKPGGSYCLNEVIQAQLAEGDVPVGNCLGLTVLYNCLAQELGLRVGTIYLSSFQGLPHVFSILYTPRGTLDIEHVFPHGFAFTGHRDNPGREVWGDGELLADINLSRGNSYFERRRWREAIACYDRALELRPAWEKALLNQAMAVDLSGPRQPFSVANLLIKS